MGGHPRKLWHLSALVGASALALALGRSAGPATLAALGLIAGCSALIYAMQAGYRRANRLANGWIDRGQGRGGTPGLALAVVALGFKGTALLATVAAAVALLASAGLVFRAFCLERYVP